MSSTAVIIAKDGAFEIHDWSFSADEVVESALAYVSARDENDADFDARRLDHQERWTGPAMQSAADDLREVCALRFDSFEAIEAFGCRVAVAVESARVAGMREAEAS